MGDINYYSLQGVRVSRCGLLWLAGDSVVVSSDDCQGGSDHIDMMGCTHLGVPYGL